MFQRRIMKIKPEWHQCNYRLEWIDHIGDKVLQFLSELTKPKKKIQKTTKPKKHPKSH